jgi:hypothetical protein
MISTEKVSAAERYNLDGDFVVILEYDNFRDTDWMPDSLNEVLAVSWSELCPIFPGVLDIAFRIDDLDGAVPEHDQTAGGSGHSDWLPSLIENESRSRQCGFVRRHGLSLLIMFVVNIHG